MILESSLVAQLFVACNMVSALPYCKRRKAGHGTGNEANWSPWTLISMVIILWYLGKIDEGTKVGVIPFHVLVLNEPLNLLLNHLLGWDEHVLEDLYQFCRAALVIRFHIFIIFTTASCSREGAERREENWVRVK